MVPELPKLSSEATLEMEDRVIPACSERVDFAMMHFIEVRLLPVSLSAMGNTLILFNVLSLWMMRFAPEIM